MLVALVVVSGLLAAAPAACWCPADDHVGQLLHPRFADGRVDQDDPDRKAMLVSLPSLPSGVYTVEYIAVSAEDDHSEYGTFAVGVGMDPPAAEAVPAAPAAELDSHMQRLDDALRNEDWSAAAEPAEKVHNVGHDLSAMAYQWLSGADVQPGGH